MLSTVLTWLPYVAGMFALAGATWMGSRAAGRILRPGVAWLALVVQAAFLLYLAALLPGVFGALTAASIGATLVAVCLGACLFWRRVEGVDGPVRPEADRDEVLLPAAPTLWSTGLIALTVVAAVGIGPLAGYLGQIPLQLPQAAFGLEWDTVSYHLPSLIEFIQNESLWYMEGAYSNYFFGYELLAALPVACFQSPWPLLGVHLLALALYLTCLYLLAARLVEDFGEHATWKPHPVMVFLLSAWLPARLLASDVARVGKNDFYMTGCLLAALLFLLECRRSWRVGGAKRVRGLLFGFTAVALGLALSSKPPVLAYWPVFTGLIAWTAPSEALAGRNGLRARLVTACIVMGAATALGGFFLGRDLLLLGSIRRPESGWGDEMALMHALLDSKHWTWHRGSVALSAAVLSMALPAWVGWRRSRSRSELWIWVAMLALQLLGLVAFVVTPFTVVQPGDWDLRYGLPLFTLAALLLAFGVVHGVGALSQPDAWPVWRAVGVAGALGAAFWLPSFFALRQPIGLPGHEEVRGLPPTYIYRIVQRLDTPIRIYAAGLFPLGLYGRNYANRVFYDMRSQGRFYTVDPAHVTKVLEQFGPDIIIIGVDPWPNYPEPNTLPPVKPPIVDWLRQQSCFKELYSDATVSAFEVGPTWSQLLEKYPPKPGAIHMGI